MCEEEGRGVMFYYCKLLKVTNLKTEENDFDSKRLNWDEVTGDEFVLDTFYIYRMLEA